MRVIVAGSRTITSLTLVEQAIEESGIQITELISGGARGVDSLGEEWAKQRRIPVRRFKADWKARGLAAGPIRNGLMSAYGQALVALWDGQSKGTADMIKKAEKAGLQLFVKVLDSRPAAPGEL